VTKRKWIGVLALVLVLVWVFPVFSQESFPPVVAIRVEGNQHISERLILSAVSLSLKEPFNPEKVKNDLKAIYDLGYFSKVWVDTKKYPDGVEVIYKVKEFPVIQDIAISGNTALTTEEIRKVMIVSPGQVMNWKIFQRDLERIKALYSDSGFIVAYMDGINFENGVLNFTLHEGIIEEVVFEGLEKTKEYVLRRELDFEPPVIFDFARIKKNMQKIYDLGFFEDLSMKLEPGSDQEHIKVVIGVVEKKTGLAGVGIGYNTEEGWLGYIRYQEANLGGNGQKVELRYEFGSRTLYRLYFEEPWFLGDPTLLALSLYDQIKERTNYEDGEEIGEYEEERIGGQLVFGRKINEDWSWRLTAKSEKIDITVLEGEAPDRGGVTNSLSPMIIYDTRDSVLDPKKGWYASLEAEFAGGALGGDNTFAKYVLDVRHFIDTGPDTVLALRLLGGTSDTSLPDYEKFGVGGVNTLRGYDLFEFEGEKMLVCNLEYRWTVSENTQVVFFGDAGYAWPYEEPVSFEDIKTGYGVGIRVDTPIGPVRLDYGIGERGGQTYFSIGHTF